MIKGKFIVIRLLLRHIDFHHAVQPLSRPLPTPNCICPQSLSGLQVTGWYVSLLYTLLLLLLHSQNAGSLICKCHSRPCLRFSLRSGTRIVELLHASPRTGHRFRPPFSSISHRDRRRLLRVEVAQYRPHLVAQSLKWLLAWRRVHWVGREIVEEDAVHNNKADQAPLHDFGPLIPGRLDRLQPCATLELALKVELLLLGELAEVRRPYLLRGISIAGEVERRQLALLAAKQAVYEAHRRHGGGISMRQLATTAS
jgi:hypothetical protein